QTAADLLLHDVRSWLEMDEHALAGGLAAKLSEAEGRAIKLLTPPKLPQLLQPPQTPQPAGAKKWVQVGTGAKTRLTITDWSSLSEELRKQLEVSPRLRLTIQWSLEEEPK